MSLALRRLTFQTIRAGALPLLLACGAAGCGPPVLSVQATLVTQMCGGTSAFPYNGQVVQFTIFGDGVNSADFQTTATISSGQASIPQIPVGTARNIVAEVLDENAQGAVVARGETGPVDYNGKSQKVNVTIFIRPVNAFVPANSTGSPQTCTTLGTARIGHTATLLENGKVLIAGGYTYVGSQATYLNTTEIFDPTTGTIAAGPTMSAKRAFQAAVHLPGTNYTILVGGEGGTASTAALSTGDVYDESQNQFTTSSGISLPASCSNGLTRLSAAVPGPLANGSSTGIVLLFGGLDAHGDPQNVIFTFDPSNGFLDEGLRMSTGRAEAQAIPVQGGVLVVGGVTGSTGSLAPAKDVTGALTTDGVNYKLFESEFGLNGAHIFPLAGTLADGSIAILDGLSSQGSLDVSTLLTDADNSADVVASSYQSSTAWSTAPSDHRALGGAVTLLNGTVLIAGGGNETNGSATALSSGTVVFQHNGTNSLPVATPMSSGRIGAAYTLLDDGTVLVTGGYDFTGSAPQALSSIDVYQPEYNASGNTAHVMVQ